MDRPSIYRDARERVAHQGHLPRRQIAAVARLIGPEAARYAAVGVLNTAVDWVAFFALVALGVPPWIANGAAWGTSIASAYPLNARFTFRSPLAGASFAGFVAVALIGVAASTVALVTVFPVAPLWIAKTAATVVSFAVTYTLNRSWTFARA